MSLVQIFLQYEAAHDTVEELGNLGLIQFKDMKPDVNTFHRTFISEVKRADELERKLRYFGSQLCQAVEENLLPEAPEPLVDDRYEEYEAKFDEIERELQQMSTNYEMLERNQNELIELQHVLEQTGSFFDQAGDAQALADNAAGPVVGGEVPDAAAKRPLLGPGGVASGDERLFPKAIELGFLAGVVLREKLATFERVLWRATRGNLFMRQMEIPNQIRDPHTGTLTDKNVFVIFYQGERAQQKIKKICESFGANMYPVKQTAAERVPLLSQVRSQLDELRTVLSRTAEQRRRLLVNVSAHQASWTARVTKEKAIFHILNMFDFDVGRRCLMAEGWCPTRALTDVQIALKRGTQRAGAQIPSILNVIGTKEEPPTYHRTNKFTKSFQDMIDSYGIARYQEVNPAVFSIITFPFLFGVMFGDIGHGVIMLLFALVLVLREEQFKNVSNEMLKMLFSGRYLLLLMAAFGIYAGFLYNEVFSIPINWGSAWVFAPDYIDPVLNVTVVNPSPINYPPWKKVNGSSPRFVPFGCDSAWKNSVNELQYFNSLKMKLSIVMGVGQMTLGIFLSLLNAIHFRKPLDAFFEFLPQIIFLLSLFGYMVVLIIIKWLTPYGVEHSSYAPLILNVMIDMFMLKWQTTDPIHMPHGDDSLFPGQKLIQHILLAVAFLAVPFMLVPKPVFLYLEHKRKHSGGYQRLDDEHHHDHHDHADHHDHHGDDIEDAKPNGKPQLAKPAPAAAEAGHDEHEDFSEVVVHQIIHTIEFVLGAISNTASYLRLWALSLAHAELSYVFWALIFIKGMKAYTLPGPTQSIALFIAFAVWAALTIFVLLVMESLSAFLHALRLHWVEFMNKFYRGDGKKFAPFSFQKILSGEDD